MTIIANEPVTGLEKPAQDVADWKELRRAYMNSDQLIAYSLAASAKRQADYLERIALKLEDLAACMIYDGQVCIRSHIG
jgi:hypothetical protein